MFSKKSIPIILLLLLGGVGALYAVRIKGIDNPVNKYERILQTVGAFLEEGHYSPQKIDDEFSKKVFKSYMNDLDADHGYFLESDFLALEPYSTHIDDEIHGSKVETFYAINKIYQKRMNEVSGIYKEILAKPFDFSSNEDVNLNYEKLGYPKTEQDRYEQWRRRLKYLTLDRYVDLLEQRDKKGKDSLSVNTSTGKSDKELEAEARQSIVKMMDRTFNRLKVQFTPDEQFNLLVNTITSTMDPHTTFFPPVERRAFDEQMSGRFFGIGASLKEEDGKIRVASLVTGSPAWKSGHVQVGDIIMKVAQSAKDSAKDLSGFATEDAVKLIRGSKGSTVYLTLKKADGSLKVVALVRDEIVLEDTFAKSAIISGAHKIGYIYLPEFYADFDRPNGVRCSIDVAREVVKLKEQKVDGIILDLRDNGGGSLMDVVRMVGLFINNGPVVQVRGRGEDNPQVLKDPDQTVLYDGPLAVMVNEFSASASEIFAAAIQDYHRGLIIGSTTYGKGTVQRNIELDPRISGMLSKDSSGNDLGSIKLTLQKFYRISGGSTQLKGVTPDISIPDKYEYLKMRERDNPDALKWDEISKASYQAWQPGYDVNLMRKESLERVDHSASFQGIVKETKWLSDQNDKVYSLQLDKFRAERKEMQKIYQDIEKLNRLPMPLAMQLMKGADSAKSDQARVARTEQWLGAMKSDLGLGEAVNVMNDAIQQGSLVKK